MPNCILCGRPTELLAARGGIPKTDIWVCLKCRKEDIDIGELYKRLKLKENGNEKTKV